MGPEVIVCSSVAWGFGLLVEFWWFTWVKDLLPQGFVALCAGELVAVHAECLGHPGHSSKRILGHPWVATAHMSCKRAWLKSVHEPSPW